MGFFSFLLYSIELGIARNRTANKDTAVENCAVSPNTRMSNGVLKTPPLMPTIDDPSPIMKDIVTRSPNSKTIVCIVICLLLVYYIIQYYRVVSVPQRKIMLI
jgi:hypothetical protein